MVDCQCGWCSKCYGGELPTMRPLGVNVNANIGIAQDYSWVNPGALAGL